MSSWPRGASPPTVVCSSCGKEINRKGALGVNGRWSCAGAKCFGKALRTIPTVGAVSAQLGLFKGSPR